MMSIHENDGASPPFGAQRVFSQSDFTCVYTLTNRFQLHSAPILRDTLFEFCIDHVA